MPWEKHVFSDMVETVGYDEESNNLLIRWKKSNRMSAYQGVPEELAVQLSNALSVGQMLNSEIKPNYPHRYV